MRTEATSVYAFNPLCTRQDTCGTKMQRQQTPETNLTQSKEVLDPTESFQETCCKKIDKFLSALFSACCLCLRRKRTQDIKEPAKNSFETSVANPITSQKISPSLESTALLQPSISDTFQIVSTKQKVITWRLSPLKDLRLLDEDTLETIIEEKNSQDLFDIKNALADKRISKAVEKLSPKYQESLSKSPSFNDEGPLLQLLKIKKH
jgi:hypothetical protein